MGGLLSPNIPVLRPYQQDDVERIRSRFASGVCRVCYQLPTGGGKTIAFCFIVAASVAKGTRVLILAHRTEILEQIDRALTQFGVPHGIIAAGYPSAPNEAVQVASVFTLALRPNLVDGFDFVIIDEAHHAVATTWKNIIDALSGAKVLGVTATPERLDGKGLNDIFEELIAVHQSVNSSIRVSSHHSPRSDPRPPSISTPSGSRLAIIAPISSPS